MALRWIEGFETFGAVGRTGQVLKDDVMVKYSLGSLSSTNSDILVGGRNGGVALRLWAVSEYIAIPLDLQPTWIVGVAFNCYSPGSPTELIRLMRDTSSQCSLRLNASRRLEVYSGSVRATGNTVLQQDQWYYIEWKTTIADSGTTELHINGAVEIPETSGLDLKTLATADANRIEIGSGAGRGVDDIYIADGNPGINSFLGEVRIEALMPNGDYGTPAWTPSTGTDHYSLVDDNPADGDTTYAFTDTPGTEDLFEYGDLTLSGDIVGVQLNTRARVDSAARNLTAVVHSGETEQDLAACSVTLTSYREFATLLLQAPATSAAWTSNGINAARFGVKMTA